MPLKTEYQLHFDKDKYGEDKENYFSRLTFRKSRTSHEKQHTPLIWVDTNEKVDTNGSVKENDDIKINTDTDDTKVIETTVESANELPVSEKPIEEDSTTNALDQDENAVALSKDIGTQSPTKVDGDKPEKRRVLRPLNRKKPIEHDKPIIAYGWADRESLQAKKTFNVLAPKTEVRSSALRAQHVRDAQKQKRLSGREKLRREKLKQQEIIDALTHFNQWETEYRHQFSPK